MRALEKLKKIRLIRNDKVYIVGGWLRDLYLNKAGRDLDLIVKENPRRLAGEICRSFNGRIVVLDDINKVFRIVLRENRELDYIDAAKFKGPSIVADLKMRDFTVNSFAAPLNCDDFKKNVIDPCAGISDVKKGVIRMVSSNTFKDDPLRMLRAFRFAGELGFRIDDRTFKSLKNNRKRIIKSAPERIRDELFKIFGIPDSSKWIKKIDESGVLDILFPEIIRMKRSARKFYFHPSGLWQHAVETLMSFEEILKNINALFPGCSGKVLNHLEQPLSSGITRKTLLKLICLMHDTAKPKCAKKVGARMRFLGHDSEGAKMLSHVLRRLRAGKKEIKTAKVLIEHHMRPISLGQSAVLTQRAIYRLFRDMEDNLPDLMLLALSDCYSYRKLKVKKTVELEKIKKMAGKLMSAYFEKKEKKPVKKIIDGHIILDNFPLEPGPLIGSLLKEINELQAIGRLKTTKNALEYIKSRLTRLKKRAKIN
jgi:poly(A) polymerase